MQTTLLITALAALITTSVADNCTPGLRYCGYGLLKKGNYAPQLDQLSSDLGQGVQYPTSWSNALFACQGGRNGVISLVQQCGTLGCTDGGSGHSDFCTPSRVMKKASTAEW